MEYTNKDLLIALREELLRRKALVDKSVDFFEYNKSKFEISTIEFAKINNRNFGGFIIRYHIKKIKNNFYCDDFIFDKCDKGTAIIVTNHKHFDICDVSSEFIIDNNIIIPKEKINEYLEYIEYLQTKMPQIDKIHMADSDSILSSNYNFIYDSCDDSLLIHNEENNKFVELCFLEELLNTKIDESQYTDYALGLIENSDKKDIIFDENNPSLINKYMKYAIDEEDNALVLKRTKRVAYLPVTKNISIPVKYY